MKRYRFPLQAVLRVRRIDRDREAAATGAAARAADLATAELAVREAAYASVRPMEGLRSPKAYLIEQAQRNLQASGVVGARGRRSNAAAELLAAKARLAAAASAVAALEELDERARKEHGRELARAESRWVDDLVTGVARADER